MKPLSSSPSDLAPLKCISVLGTSLAISTYETLVTFLFNAARQTKVLAIDFSNTHIVTMRRHARTFRKTTSCMDIFIPDGMPLVWSMNAQGADMKDRVYGPTFLRKMLERCPPNFTHYLIGGSKECAIRLEKRMLALNPTLQFVGGFHGPCNLDGKLEPPSEDDRIIKEIQHLKPTYIWVGLGTPKQYHWINHAKTQIDQGIMLAVGFAFDVNAGTKPDAPQWMQDRGLTWLYRMLSEPRRLLTRYLKWNSLFLFYTALEWKSSRGK